MSGHSRWATIKRKKGAADAKKGQIFTKLVREITTAVRMGGGDPEGNPRLRAAIAVARAARMPMDNVERAIKKGSGALEGPPVEETMYEGYGPGGIAILVEAQTENRNRTTAEVRAAFTKGGGNLGASGGVAWMFHKRAQFVFDASKYTEDQIMELALENGADDVTSDKTSITVTGDLKSFGPLFTAFEKKGFVSESSELTMVPENTVKVAGEDAERVVKLIEKLEELDDVQKVHANFEMDEADLERIAALG